MSLGKAMIHARKQKSIARAAALTGEHTAGQYTVQTTHLLQMPVLVLNASYEPINICGAGGHWCWCSRALRAPRRSMGLPFMLSAAASPCPPSSGCSSIAAFLTRRARFRGRTSCCATATPASIAARRFPRRTDA